MPASWHRTQAMLHGVLRRTCFYPHSQLASITCGRTGPTLRATAAIFGTDRPGREIPEEKLLLLPSRPRQFMEAVNQIETPFTARTYAQRLSITPRTAQKDLQILIKKGLVSREGEGKNTRYRFC